MAMHAQEGTGGAGSPVGAAQPGFGHEPEDAWFGRLDTGETGDTRRVHQIVRGYDFLRPGAEPGTAVLMGFACDAGVHRNQGRTGAVDGPWAVRRMLANLAVDGFDTVLDAGDIACRDGGLEIAQQVYADAVQRLLAQELRPVLLGGGHEIAWGSFMGLRGYLDAREDRGHVLVLNLDAHLDLRTSRPASSGTPFDQIARHCEAHGLPWRYACLGVSRPNNTAVLFERAREVGAVVVDDEAMQERNLEALRMQVRVLLEAADHVYLTIDLDVLPGAVAPGVSAPAALGVPLAMVEAVVEWVCVSGKLRLADLAELNPALDRDGQTARVAARLAWRLLRGMSRQAGAARQESFF